MPQKIIRESLVLNVDDSDGARYAKSKILTRAGLTVIEARNGGEALELALAEQPYLVLLDTRLPDINGFEVCRRLKTDPRTSAIIVLQTSASYLKIADKVHALELGADNYLFEPVEPEELVANVKALLRLAKVERQLRDVDRRKDEFLATLAHELRNPLGPIRSAVELLKTLNPAAPPAQQKAHEIIMRQTDHMVRLIEDLLDVSRITEGKIALQIGPVEVQTFVRNAIETNAPIFQARGHQLEVVMPPQPVWFDGDAVRMAQVVGNLLHNAAKFTPLGGHISLTVEAGERGLTLRVADNGIGLARDNLADIFDLFVQDGHTADRVQDGLGIGLSLVKKLVEMHHGAISASSPGPGLGSVFEVQLPVPFRAVSALPAPVPAAPKAAAMRILLVDDNRDAADMLADLLQLYGHEVRTSYTGAHALAAAPVWRPDTVFLDIGLPDMSGHEVALRLRAMPELARAKIVALTGYGSAYDKQRALESVFDAYFVKPIDAAQLETLNVWSAGADAAG